MYTQQNKILQVLGFFLFYYITGNLILACSQNALLVSSKQLACCYSYLGCSWDDFFFFLPSPCLSNELVTKDQLTPQRAFKPAPDFSILTAPSGPAFLLPPRWLQSGCPAYLPSPVSVHLRVIESPSEACRESSHLSSGILNCFCYTV